MRAIPHLYAFNASVICKTRLIHMWDITHPYAFHHHSYAFYASFTWEKWLICTRNMTHPYAFNACFTRKTRRIYMRDTTQSYALYASFKCKTWLICMRDMTDPYVWHPFFVCVTWLMPTTHASYGVATASRIDKIIGLFCRISSLL